MGMIRELWERSREGISIMLVAIAIASILIVVILIDGDLP
jgi:hypothetical protein